MEAFEYFINNTTDFLWAGEWAGSSVWPLPLAPIAVLLLGAGAWFMLALRFLPLRRLGPAFGELWRGRHAGGEGAITPWQALSTALSGQVGTGNLAGVATAVAWGGPGAIFWMWITAFLGMAAAFAESSLAVKYREQHENGNFYGGPMYYIRNGLGKKWLPLAAVFAFSTILCAFVTGNMVQANSISTGLTDKLATVGFDVEQWQVGIVIAAAVFAVIIGGIKSIGSVAGRVVPFMAAAYILLALVVLITNIHNVPAAFGLIIGYAFGIEELTGGVAGYTVAQMMRFGIARGLFSNEAGQGSTPIAHAAAKIDDPVKQGEIAMLGAFIDTLIICTLTALVLLTVKSDFPGLADGVTNGFAWQSTTLEGISITTAAYEAAIPFGGWFIMIALTFFAFTTIIGWSYYAEQSLSFLVGDKAEKVFRYLWVVVVLIGASISQVKLVWTMGDLANALMALPNLIAIVALSGVVMKMVAEAREKRKLGRA